MSAVEALLTRIVDYAGLFPPASLDMDAPFAIFRAIWAATTPGCSPISSFPPRDSPSSPTPLSHLLRSSRSSPGPSASSPPPTVRPRRPAGHRRFSAGRSVSLRRRNQGPHFAYGPLHPAHPPTRPRPLRRDRPRSRRQVPAPCSAAAGARAKLRTGGITPAAIPAPEAIAGFLLECAHARVPFKATAGLHHAVRGVQPLTYQLGSPTATTYGFLNVFLAATLAFHGANENQLVKTLTEQDPKAFQLDEYEIAWHDHRMHTDQIERVRAEFAIGFGSCSFTEPIDDLKSMGWL